MNVLRFVIVIVALVAGACDDTAPAKDPSNPNASASPAPTTPSHTPAHGLFNGP
jgi:hypothetical protein